MGCSDAGNCLFVRHLVASHSGLQIWNHATSYMIADEQSSVLARMESRLFQVYYTDLDHECQTLLGKSLRKRSNHYMKEPRLRTP